MAADSFWLMIRTSIVCRVVCDWGLLRSQSYSRLVAWGLQSAILRACAAVLSHLVALVMRTLLLMFS